jgi:hypothetical protein
MNIAKAESLPAQRRAFPPTRAWRRRRSVARPRAKVAFSLWLPLSALVALLAPLALLSIPVLQIPLARRRISAGKVVLAAGGLLFALSGTVIDIDARGARIRVRIF